MIHQHVFEDSAAALGLGIPESRESVSLLLDLRAQPSGTPRGLRQAGAQRQLRLSEAVGKQGSGRTAFEVRGFVTLGAKPRGFVEKP